MVSISSMNLREMRIFCINLGIEVPADADKEGVIRLIQEKEASIQSLRLECARRGLPTDGEENDLRLRLVASDPATITEADRQLYTMTGRVFIAIGFAALLVSIPHITGELCRITGLHWLSAAALALVIDGAIVACKMADTLSAKFSLGRIRTITTSLMLAALGFSAAVNASGFLHQGVSGAPLACLFALLLSGTVYACFQAGSFFLTVQQRQEEEPAAAATVPVCPVGQLKQAAARLESLLHLASKAK